MIMIAAIMVVMSSHKYTPSKHLKRFYFEKNRMQQLAAYRFKKMFNAMLAYLFEN